MIRSGPRLYWIGSRRPPTLTAPRSLPLQIHPHDGDYHFYDRRGCVRLLAENGWDVEASRRLNWWAYGVVARRR